MWRERERGINWDLVRRVVRIDVFSSVEYNLFWLIF